MPESETGKRNRDIPAEGRVIAVMGPRVVAGFALAGIDVQGVDSVRQAEDTVRDLLADEESRYALVIVAEKFSAEFSPHTRELMWQSLRPMVVEVPVELGMGGVDTGAGYVGEIVEKAIGFSIKLE